MIVGHQKQWQYLTKLAEVDKLPHALLFSGQEKLGKKTLALELIKLLSCQGGKVLPCQTCRSCQDIQKRIHPDLTLIKPIGKEIQISQIRECIWRLSLKPSISPFKAAIIDQAHYMNQEAQSALLKTLEEPKGNTLLILISEYPETLFPTILSRVQKIKFYPVKKKEIEDYLKKQDIEEKASEEILKFSLLKPGKVIDFISDPQKLKAQKKAIMDLIKVSNSDLSLRFQYAKDLSLKPQDLKETLNIWLFHFRNVLISTINYQLSRSDLDKFRKLKNTINLIQKTNFLIFFSNVNPRLALEILMLEL